MRRHSFVIILVCVLLSSGQTLAQDFGFQTVVYGTESLELTLISSPSTAEKDIWLNWTLSLTVVEWNSEWTANDTQFIPSKECPSLAVMVKTPHVNFSRYHNVSFGMNMTHGFSFSVIFIGPMHVFTYHGLGNLSGVTNQTLVVSVRFGTDMPDAEYTVDIHIHDPRRTTTIPPTTTTTTTEGTTSEPTEPLGLDDYIIPLSLTTAVIMVAALVIRRRKSTLQHTET